MQLFYCPEIVDNAGYLTDDEANHCVRVLRKKTGDLIDITDGKGSFYQAKLTHVSAHECKFEIIKSEHQEPAIYFIHIAIAPTKNIDRIEWFVEKAIEIGVSEISFILSTHSERNRINLERIQKKAISAMKQSLRPFLPKINDMQPVALFAKNCTESQKYVAHLNEASTPFLSDIALKAKRYAVIIGPEGGFSEEEISLFSQQGFGSVKLGNYRLRTETAGVMTCAMLNTINFT
jgi:16S rRNA (uracil1498-N3)-methyltransferase